MPTHFPSARLESRSCLRSTLIPQHAHHPAKSDISSSPFSPFPSEVLASAFPTFFRRWRVPDPTLPADLHV